MTCTDLATLPDSLELNCDICIVGSGPAGATLAKELSSSRLRIMVVESGGLTRSAEADHLNRIENVGWPRTPDQWMVRNRILGGSSHTWFGRSVSFDEIDYEHRAWVPFSGWPFSQSHIDPYLARSAVHLGLAVGTGFSDASFWDRFKRDRPRPALDDTLLPCFWQFSQDRERKWESMRFGNHLPNLIGPDVTVLINATVTQILTNADADMVNGVEVSSLNGSRRRLNCRVVVLCAGGLENPRLLLTSNQTKPAGLGNDHDQVGRYLMDHLRGNLATFRIDGSEALQKYFGYYRILGHNFLHGMRLAPRVQREERLLNASAWVAGDLSFDDPWEAVKRIVRRTNASRGDLIALAKNFRWLARGATTYLIEKVGLPHKLDQLNLMCMCEQVPDPESRVTLSRTPDRFGTPLLRVDWRVHDLERKSLCRIAHVVSQAFSKAGFPRPHLEKWVRDGGALPRSFVDVAHPIGTTRMGTDPSTSVVDVNGQVHGVEGLFIAGSSTFPTSSHANPTLMIVAMAIRLSDILKSQLSAAGASGTHRGLEMVP